MCGLVGAITDRDIRACLNEAVGALAHRGPDGSGIWHAGRVWLGHRRLAIISPTAAASQPMHKAGFGTIVYNGELYDFVAHRRRLEERGLQFDTASDTEVVLKGLASFGPNFLCDSHGMFALAWLSADARTLLLARDHAGMKPLYVWRRGGEVAFASEVRALALLLRGMGARLTMDPDSVASFMAYGSIPEPHTILQSVEMLPADSALEIDVAQPSAPQTHALGIVRRRRASPFRPAVMRAAVARHTVSDVPVGLFLSAGLDSSVIAAELSRFPASSVEAITIASGRSDAGDEPDIARNLARRLGLRHRVIRADDWIVRLENVFRAFDQPSVDGFNTYVISSVARELGLRVAITGVGADEVFGGYAHFRRARLERAVPALQRIGAHRLLLRSRYPRLRRLGLLADAAEHSIPVQYGWRRLLSTSDVARLLPQARERGLAMNSWNPLEAEQRTYLLNTLLRDADVMGMAHGVELRAPYLDPDVMSGAEAIGYSALLDPHRRVKWPLAEGWREVLGPAITRRRKTGFTLDLRTWLTQRTEAMREARERLTGAAFVDPVALQALWRRGSEASRRNSPSGLPLLIALVQLAEQYSRWGEPG